MNSILLLGIGFLAQGMFSARFLIQLIRTEKSGEVANPVIFWQLSLFASFLLMVYGTFRHDLVIVGGQLVGYLIYIRNLQFKGSWKLFPRPVRWFFLYIPLLFFVYMGIYLRKDFYDLLDTSQIDTFLLTWGTLGQVVFTGRFVIQWYVSEKLKESVFPPSFWYVSIVGSVIIASYALFRKDAVLFIGQAFGLVVYVRNLWVEIKPTKVKITDLLLRLKDSGIYILLILMGFVLFFNLGSWSVTETSEARYAEISKEMFLSGDWIHPNLMGIHHYHKPPFTYWITAFAYSIFGITPFAARFFLQIAALLQIFLVFKMAELGFKDKRKALISAILYAACPLVIIGTRALTTDMYLTTWVLAGLYFNWNFKTSGKPMQALVSFVCYGFGFLTKGPVVWIVPFTLELASWIYDRKFPKITWIQGLGWVLMLGVGASWFVQLILEDRSFIDYFFFTHTVDRFATNTFSRSQPIWFYVLILLVLTFPWFALILSKLKKTWKGERFQFILTFGFLVGLLFFSISKSKLVLYILPLMVGMILAAVSIWEDLSESEKSKWEKAQLIFNLVIWSAFIVVPWIDSRVVLSSKFWLIWVLSLSVLLSIWKSGIRVGNKAIFASLNFTVGLTIMSVYFFTANPEVGNDNRRVAAWINEHIKPGDKIIIYNRRLPSISFHENVPIVSIFDGNEELHRETQFEKGDQWKAYLINLQENPEWLEDFAHTQGIWISKKNKPLPVLPEGREWKEEVVVDGWSLSRIQSSGLPN